MLSTIVGLAVAASAAQALELPQFLFKDVVIVGGGASGAYAAVSLRDDYGKSIALVEMQSILGGAVDTYVSPSGKPYDFGVEAFTHVGNSTAFFDRFNITLGAPASTDSTTTYVDFKTGNPVNFTGPSVDAQMAAMQKYLDIVEPWENITAPKNFPDAADIPEDWLLPYGEFITKYGLEAAMPSIYVSTGMGLANVSDALTLDALRVFGSSMARAMLGTQALNSPVSGSNQELYDAVAKDLGDDVLYDSKVISSWRTDLGVFLTVKNSKTGKYTIITARKLLLAIEPTASNLAPFDLDDNESAILGKLHFTREYTAVVNNSAFEANVTYLNLPADAAPNNFMSYPDFSETAFIQYMGEHYFHVIIVGDEKLDEAGAKDLLNTNFNTLLKSKDLDPTAPASGDIDIVDFSNHGYMHARVGVDDIKDGFYQKMYALQGGRSTYFTGGAFHVYFQTDLWAFDDMLIPEILASLN